MITILLQKNFTNKALRRILLIPENLYNPLNVARHKLTSVFPAQRKEGLE